MRGTHYLISLCLVATACSSPVRHATEVDMYPPLYPDYIGVTIPAELAPLSFNFADEEITTMDVIVEGKKGQPLHSRGAYADFSIKAWQRLTAENVGDSLMVTVAVRRDGQWYRYRPFPLYVSRYPLTDYGVTYRRIAPGYEAGGNIGIYQRDLHSYKESPILTEYATPSHCMNCHSANRGDPQMFTIQLRGEHGATILQRNGVQKFLNTKTDSTGAACSYTYWHPSGDYIAFSTNAVYQAFFVGRYKPKEVYHTFSNIVIYDTRSDELILEPRLQTEWQEIWPAFSADGTTLYYSSSPPCTLPEEYMKVQCSLCAIAFDATTGTFGETVDTLLNGPHDGYSYILARPSYDGKWLMYTRCRRSNFAVEQRDADLWMMDLTTGECRELTALNSPFSDGYHNWSSDSHWVVVASKRGDAVYGQLYFAEIDDDGNASKPFLLPQRDPRTYYRGTFDAYNAPDFTVRRVQFDIHSARKAIFSDKRQQVQIR